MSKLRLAAVIAAVVAALVLASGVGASSNNQIVLSGIGPSTVGFSGFWLWSQPGGNAYHVTSKIGTSIDCRFSATETSKPGGPHGANGWVSFSCSAPSVAGTPASGTYPATVVISSLS